MWQVWFKNFHEIILGKKYLLFKTVQGEVSITYVLLPVRDFSYASVWNPLHFPSLIQQVKKFTSHLLFKAKKINTYVRDSPEYMVVTRELKFIFLCTCTLTCPRDRAGCNFICNLFSKIWILTTLNVELPIYDSLLQLSPYPGSALQLQFRLLLLTVL